MLLLTYQCGYTFASESWLTRMTVYFFLIQCPNRPESISNNPLKTKPDFYRETLYRPINFLFLVLSAWVYRRPRFYKSNTCWKENRTTINTCLYEAQCLKSFSFHNSNVNPGPHNAGVFFTPVPEGRLRLKPLLP